MQFTFSHNNINVMDLEKSIRFYEENLGLKETRRSAPEHGEFILVFLGDGVTNHRLELTYLRDRKEPYNLGDNEIHLALEVDDMQAAYELHKKMMSYVMKTRVWAFTLFVILMGTGLRLFQRKKRIRFEQKFAPFSRGILIYDYIGIFICLC